MRLLGPVALTVVLFAALGASSAASAPDAVSAANRAATRSLAMDVRLIQGPTSRLANGYLSSTLHLRAIGQELGSPPKSDLGSMSFTYKPSFCSDRAGATNVHCSIDNLTTVTTLPGGTITAGWTGFTPLTQLSAQCGGRSAQITRFTDGRYHEWFSGLVIPILSGTGKFEGVSGAILIPYVAREGCYRLTLRS